MADIQLSKYHVSKDIGFLLEPLQDVLPDYFEPWNRLAKSLPELVASHKFRDAVKEMPLLDQSKLAGYRQKRLAHLQLVLITSGYLWQEGEGGAVQRLPECVSKPLWNVSNDLGLKPVLTFADICLTNCKVKNGDIEVMYNLPGGAGTEWFLKVCGLVELAFGKSGQAIQNVLDGAKANDKAKMASGFTDLTAAIGNMQTALARMNENLTPEHFYNGVRPFLNGFGGPASPISGGLVYEGVSDKPVTMIGGSAAQSSTMQVLDGLLGITHSPEKQAFLDEIRNYMPPSHKQMLADLTNMPRKVPQVVAETKDANLTKAFNGCVAAFVQYRSYHIQVVTKYIVTASKSDSPKSLAYKDTGKSDLIPFLKEVRDDTEKVQQ
uniref:Myoglobin n=2 Tax=Haliotis TaxID=6452 RepID=MYG_HALMK|nr:RecName: Full=Myoglobin [Haliotis madaka]AAB31096.1 myoglobin [Haliotis madaka]BAA09586.1 indoleamine dioxygenase-like myoglobin [Haliotis madaka]BAI22679.1 myoglobin [Haliotis discus]